MTFSLFILFIIAMSILAGYEFYDYDGFIRYDIPDELVGTVMLPEEWEIVIDDDGWIQIMDTSTEEVIAEEIQRCWYSREKNYDENNPKYSEIFPLEYVWGTSHSNGGQYCSSNGSTGSEIWTWDFHSDIERYYVRLYILREDFSKEFIQQIANSYRYIGR